MKLIKLPNGTWIDPTIVVGLALVPHNMDLSNVIMNTNLGINFTVPVPEAKGRQEIDAIAAQINNACSPYV